MLMPHVDKHGKEALEKVIRVIVDDMRTRIKNGTPGPQELDYESVYQLILSGRLTINLSNTVPPRPELVVVL